MVVVVVVPLAGAEVDMVDIGVPPLTHLEAVLFVALGTIGRVNVHKLKVLLLNIKATVPHFVAEDNREDMVVLAEVVLVLLLDTPTGHGNNHLPSTTKGVLTRAPNTPLSFRGAWVALEAWVRQNPCFQ